MPGRTSFGSEPAQWFTSRGEAKPRSHEGPPPRLWGVVYAASASGKPLPLGTRARLAEFTELVATAIGNVEARAELIASRAPRSPLMRPGAVSSAASTTARSSGLSRSRYSCRRRRRRSPGHEGLQAELGQITAGLASALDELREYARGIHPAILADGGLTAALKTLTHRSPVPVHLEVRTKARLPGRVEVAAYYVVSEAMANAAKYANASAMRVAVDEAG